MHGNLLANPGRVDFIDANGLATALMGGITIATIDENAKLTPIIYGSAGNLVTAAYEKDGKRAIVRCHRHQPKTRLGWQRLYPPSVFGHSDTTAKVLCVCVCKGRMQ